jgi:hypothetical protein
MATAADQTFIMAVITAESVRQAAKASAFTTYGFVPANLATYKTALASADNAYDTSVNSARNTAVLTGNVGSFGPIGGYIGTVST